MAIKGTKRDRDKLRKRVKDALTAADLTQKDFEERHELSTGLLTRVFGGRRGVDEALLDLLVSGLGVSREALVAGTAFATLGTAASEAAPKAAARPKAAAKPKSSAKAEPAAKAKPAAPKPASAPAPKAAAAAPKAAAAAPKAAAPAPEAAPAPTPRAAAPAPAKAPTPPPRYTPPPKSRSLPVRVLRFIKGLVLGD